MALSMQENEKKALVRLHLKKDESEPAMGFATKVYRPAKQDVLLVTSPSIFPDNTDAPLNEIVVHRCVARSWWCRTFRQMNPFTVKNIDSPKQAHVSTVVFEGGDKENCLQYKVITEKDLKKQQTLSACVYEDKELIQLNFKKQKGSYKLSDVSKEGYDVKRAKGAPVLIKEERSRVLGLPIYVCRIVGVLSMNSNGDLYPVLFKDGFLDESPSSSDTEEAGPSGIDEKKSVLFLGEDVQTKNPVDPSDNKESEEPGPSGIGKKSEYSERLKEVIKVNTSTVNMSLDDKTSCPVKTDDIFTNPTVYLNERQVKTDQAKAGLNRSEQLQQYTKRTGFEFKKWEDIVKEMEGENPKLLLTGKPGIGKTTLCKKLIRDWSVNRLFHGEGAPNIQFAYLLNFHQLNEHGDKEMDLRELLNCSSLLDGNSHVDDSLFEYLTKNPSEVLIILDGYDEYSEQHREQLIDRDFEQEFPNNPMVKMPVPALCSKLIRGKVMRNAVVLVSSRPDKAEDLKEIDVFEACVDIAGFSPDQVTEYIKKYFSKTENLANLVGEFITGSEDFLSICHIPLVSFSLCWCLERQIPIAHRGSTKNLPAKITDLYDEVVKVLIQKLHASLKYSASPENTPKITQETLDKLAKLAASNLLKKSKYVFNEEDMKKLNLTEKEIESLKVSGLLHCKTRRELSFIHLILEEFFAASFFVKNKEIPKKNEASGQTFVFISGLSSREKNEKLMKTLVQQITPKDCDDNVNKLLMLQCLYEYGDDKLTQEHIGNVYDRCCDKDGWVKFVGVKDRDSTLISYFLYVTTKPAVEPSTKHLISPPRMCITSSLLTSAGLSVICRSLVNSFVTHLSLISCGLDDKCIRILTESLMKTEITDLDLSENDVTDEGAEHICRTLIRDHCLVKSLSLMDNKITVGCKERVENRLRKHKPGVLVFFGENISAMEKEEDSQKEEEQQMEKEECAKEKEEQQMGGTATSFQLVSLMKELTISLKPDEASIELTQEEVFWDISKYGALLEFPPNSVGSPTQVVCKACSCESTPSPEADMMETLVSHLVQLGPSSVELQEPVIVTLLHAGPGKKSGYETIVKAFDDEERIWKEIKEFNDTSHIPKNYKADNVIQVKISKLTSLAVISRLITDTFEVTPGGCVVRSSVCDDVTVTVPEGAVDETITGSMKLVLSPEMIFLFSGFEGIEFLKPVTVRFPCRGSTKDINPLRVMLQEDTVDPEGGWSDVTDSVRLEKKGPGFMEFHVKHFSRYRLSSLTTPILDWWRSPKHVFLGAFKENIDSQKIIIACASMLNDCENDLKRKGYERLAVSSEAQMRHGQKAYVQLEDGLDIRTDESVFVKFIKGKNYRKEFVYSVNRNYFQNHVISREDPLYINLCFYPDTEYVEEERIDRLLIDRRRLHPKPEERPNENQNSYVTPIRLEEIRGSNQPESFDLVYKMTSFPRGISYIFNINNFNVSESHKLHGKDRKGSELDVDSLTRLFEGLHFDVKTFVDFCKSDLIAEIKRIAETDFSSYDCLVIFIMSHGKDNCICASDGEEVYMKEEIFDKFKNSECRTLQRKPKMFFIQACRGPVPDPGVMYCDNPEEQAEDDEGEDEEIEDFPDVNPQAYETDPEYSDNLYAYACFEGHLSYRWEGEGAQFISCLVDVFRKKSCTEDVLSMLTMVNNEVSKLGGLNEKQIPSPVHTLRKKVFFWPGLYNNS